MSPSSPFVVLRLAEELLIFTKDLDMELVKAERR